ncbi:hypothetical protein ABLM60_004494, partial [Shigella flexneri]
TNDDGTNFYDSKIVIDFNNSDQLIALPIGTRYVVNSTNIPNSATSTSGWLTKFNRSDSQSMLIQYQPYNSNTIYQKRFYKTWSDWEVVGNNTSDTGWVPLSLINGATKYDATGYLAPSYRLINMNGMKIVKLYGMITGLKSNTVFANIPTNVAPTYNIQLKALDRIGTNTCMFNINTNGTLAVQGSATDTSAYII